MEVSRDIVEEQERKDWPFSYFQFKRERDSPGEVRNSILVVAALIATASYQAIMDPSDGITKSKKTIRIIFLCANTLAWSSSMSIIIMLTDSFPFQRELSLAYFFMSFAAGAAAGPVIDGSVISYVLFVICAFIPWVLRWLPSRIRHICCCC